MRVNIAYRVTHLYVNEIYAGDGRHAKILVSWIETYIFIMGVIIHARLFGALRENVLYSHEITYTGHYEKSLLRDNDSRCNLQQALYVYVHFERAFSVSLYVHRCTCMDTIVTVYNLLVVTVREERLPYALNVWKWQIETSRKQNYTTAEDVSITSIRIRWERRITKSPYYKLN